MFLRFLRFGVLAFEIGEGYVQRLVAEPDLCLPKRANFQFTNWLKAAPHSDARLHAGTERAHFRKMITISKEDHLKANIVAPATYNPDTSPSRIRPRDLFDIALGSDSMWKKGHYSIRGKLTVVNLMNKVALYNFFSSFSGTTTCRAKNRPRRTYIAFLAQAHHHQRRVRQ